MKKHDIVNKLSVAKYHVEKARGLAISLGVSLIGVDIRTHLDEAIAKFDDIDHKIQPDILKLKGQKHGKSKTFDSCRVDNCNCGDDGGILASSER